ncbi:hypothetical protein IGI04_036081 [Brassica rapa subsp. trilocularis]|uniref:CCHC-type domain-containing protein n=1 Tax=Brassica rapa subsp. trilocularis TaxID=1813537 RepID=A0ABQ7LFV0_BRACM|nr:hypothetical protein IGI04_036081 [Brassica rapa subsp. trilocularis]
MMFSDHVTYVFVVGSVQLRELGLCVVRDPRMCCVWRHPLSGAEDEARRRFPLLFARRKILMFSLVLLFMGSRQVGSRSRMRNVVRLRRVGQVSGAAGYDGSSESSSSSESASDSNFEDENVVESTESSHETGSSEFEEAEVLEEVEEESDHLEGMNFFAGTGAIPQASDSFNYHTVAVNIIDISSRESSLWISMPAWSPAFSLGGSLDYSLESIGQSFDPYNEYHYSPMPMESPPANPKVGTGAREVDMEVQPEIVRDVQMMESTQNGRTRPNGALGGQVEKGSTSRRPASNVQDSRNIPTEEECNVCGADDHHTRACTRIRSQPDLSAYLICSSCETRGHFIADCPMTNVTIAVPISVVPPTSLLDQPHLQQEDQTLETLTLLGVLIGVLVAAKFCVVERCVCNLVVLWTDMSLDILLPKDSCMCGKIWNQRKSWYRSATSVQRFRVVNVKVQSRQRMFKSRRAVWGFKRSDGVIFLPRRIFVQSVHGHVCKTRAISDRASEEATKAVTEALRPECMMFEMVMS